MLSEREMAFDKYLSKCSEAKECVIYGDNMIIVMTAWRKLQ